VAESFGDKQHEATPHRREKAREEGQIARSHDLAAAAVLVGGLIIVLYFGGDVVDFLGQYTRRQLAEPSWQSFDRDMFMSEWYGVVLKLAQNVLPALGLVMLVGLVANVGQVGLLWLPSKLAWDFDRLNPVSGAQRLFSIAAAVRLTFGIGKILVVTAVAYWCLWSERDELVAASELDIGQLTKLIIDIAFWTCIKIGSALLILALMDYAYQWWKQEQDLRMTSQEMREEMKYLQGDPQVIARRKAVQRQLIMQRIRNAVPKADVVVTNPTELAIAIQYDPLSMAAPIVVAKGAGPVAQRIRRLALESSVPIVERKELARYLYKNVDIGKPIPAEQYAAMAEVLRYVYQLKGKTLPNMTRAA
jgi:flagellar biosynthetic protein FlhB